MLGSLASAREDPKATLMANLYKALRWKCQIPGTKQIKWYSNDSNWPPWDWRILQSTLGCIKTSVDTDPPLEQPKSNNHRMAERSSLSVTAPCWRSIPWLPWPMVVYWCATPRFAAKKENLRRRDGGLQQLGVSSWVVPKRYIVPVSYPLNSYSVVLCTQRRIYIFLHLFTISCPQPTFFAVFTGPLVARWTLTTMHPTDRRKSMRSAMWAKRIPLKWRPRSTISTTSSWSLVEDEEDEMIDDDRWWSVMGGGWWVGGFWGC